MSGLPVGQRLRDCMLDGRTKPGSNIQRARCDS